MSAAALVKQADMKRIMKGAKQAGYNHVRVQIDRQGNIVVDASTESSVTALPGRKNPLDRLLEPK